MPLNGASIFDYCERTDPAFWAEPLNAATNAGFIMAAIAGLVLIARRPPHDRLLWHWFFAADFIAIGIGSFLFHTMPGKGTGLADTGPIGVFMLTYLVYALRRFAGASWLFIAAAMAVFVAAMAAGLNLQCWDGQAGFYLENVPAGARAQCLNGSLGYGPAFAALLLIGAWLAYRRHRAAPLVLAACGAFAVSLSLRTADQSLCGSWTVFGHVMGTHFLWHLFNAVTLFLLLLAGILHDGRQEVLGPRPRARPPVYRAS
jgi:Ceramidase